MTNTIPSSDNSTFSFEKIKEKRKNKDLLKNIKNIINPKKTYSFQKETHEFLDPVLEVVNLKKNYGFKKVLKDISFTIRKKDIVAVIGVNGAGKTTLFKCLLKATLKSGGIIKLDGNQNYDPETINVLWADNGFDGDISVEQNYKFFFNLYGLIYDRNNVIKLLKYFNIEKSIDTNFKDLSSGMKRKCAILRTFLRPSKFYMIDEPTDNLDMVSQNKFSLLVKDIFNNTDSAALLITHHFEDINNLCNKLLIINNGKILDYDTVENLRLKHFSGWLCKIIYNPAEEIKREFIKDLSTIEGITFKEIITNTHTEMYIKIEKGIQNIKDVLDSYKSIFISFSIEELSFKKFINLILKDIVFNKK